MIKHYRQVIFWVFIFAFLNILFGLKWSNYLDSFYFTSMLMPVAIATSYFFNLFLVPRYLETKKHFWFILYTFYTVVVSVFLTGVIAMGAFIFLTDFDKNRMSPIAGDVLQLGVIIYFVVILFSFIRVYRSNLKHEARMAALEEVNQKNLLQIITVRSNREAISIAIDDILYVESLADYVKINTTTGVTITKEKISGLEKVLPERFIRVHRSYLVNKNRIEAFGHDYVKVQAQQLPVGRKYKKEALESMKSDNILS
ncbi:LytTR family DNA-binding domain-containing protein [Roseivirga sp.]|uniref:LytR/AlgR family response regulator transcription factor n=1 Tax=Roseivirga sp. TaxID=1964215 RepID=UPI002B268827|nr:LytTR family DNA-binding domain-containing protein [Roseivirga sp.]